jgi:hypothetical protein
VVKEVLPQGAIMAEVMVLVVDTGEEEHPMYA